MVLVKRLRIEKFRRDRLSRIFTPHQHGFSTASARHQHHIICSHGEAFYTHHLQTQRLFSYLLAFQLEYPAGARRSRGWAKEVEKKEYGVDFGWGRRGGEGMTAMREYAFSTDE